MDAKIQIADISIPRFEITEYGKQKRKIPFDGYEFQFTSNFRINEEEKTLQTNFSIKLFEKLNIYAKNELAEMVIVNTLRILNFSEIIQKKDGDLLIPDGLTLLINSMTIQHSRGALIAKLQDTSYSNAILPLIDPNVFTHRKLTTDSTFT